MEKPSTVDFKTLERRTVEEWGLETLNDLQKIGYEIWITPTRALGYESSLCGRGCDGGVCCGSGRGRFSVLPNRKAFVEEIQLDPSYSNEVPFLEMWYFTKDETSNFVEQENRFGDFHVIALPPGKYLVHERYKILKDMFEAVKGRDANQVSALNTKYWETRPDPEVLYLNPEEEEYDKCRQACLLAVSMFKDQELGVFAEAEKIFAGLVDPMPKEEDS